MRIPVEELLLSYLGCVRNWVPCQIEGKPEMGKGEGLRFTAPARIHRSRQPFAPRRKRNGRAGARVECTPMLDLSLLFVSETDNARNP